jgi:hypothetical protein
MLKDTALDWNPTVLTRGLKTAVQAGRHAPSKERTDT